MPSGYEVIMVDGLARLKAPGSNWVSADKVRRAHRTAIPLESTSVLQGIHLIDGNDAPKKGWNKSPCAFREASFTVSLFLRTDAGPAAADPFKIEVMRRLNPGTASYGSGVILQAGSVSTDAEIGDKDPLRVDMEFAVCYPAPEWSLG